MATVTIEEAQARLPELIDQPKTGESLVILRQDRPVARLVGESEHLRQPRQPGCGKGSVLYMAPDFDAPLEEFREYME